MAPLLAVDGGNTKTLAVVADAKQVLGAARGGCGDIYGGASPDAALEVIEAAARAALADAGCDAGELGAAVFSLAGADWPEDFALLEAGLRERLGLPEAPLVVNDSLGALRAGSEDWTGVSVVCGTYDAIGARHPDGRLYHLGFWPDGCGGRPIGHAALQAVYRAELELGPPTALTEAALAFYGAEDPIALLHAFTRRGGRPESDKGLLAPAVLDAAEAGDAVAGALVDGQGATMGRQALVSLKAVGLGPAGTRVVLTGGLFAHRGERLAGAVLTELPGADPVRHGPPPVVGALLLGYDRLGGVGDPEALAAGLLHREGGAGWAPSPSTA